MKLRTGGEGSPPGTENPRRPSENYTRAGSGARAGDHGGAGKSGRRKSGKYGYLSLHSVRKVNYSFVGLDRHLLFLADYYCKNSFRKTTKDLSTWWHKLVKT